MTTIAYIYVGLVVAYSFCVLLLSVFIINVAPLRVAEDLVLLCLIVFACYTLVLDNRFYKEG